MVESGEGDDLVDASRGGGQRLRIDGLGGELHELCHGIHGGADAGAAGVIRGWPRLNSGLSSAVPR